LLKFLIASLIFAFRKKSSNKEGLITITEIDKRILILFQKVRELLANEKESIKKTLAEIKSLEQSRGKINYDS
jgi:nitrogen fixation/metabolism regulation signal transduction histidine kinase